MLFIPSKPNLHCLIFGHIYKFDYWGYPEKCPRCGENMYFGEGWPTLNLYHRAGRLYWRIRYAINDRFRFKSNEIPF